MLGPPAASRLCPTPANRSRTLKPRLGKSEVVAAVALHPVSLRYPVPCCVGARAANPLHWALGPSGQPLGMRMGKKMPGMLLILWNLRPIPPSKRFAAHRR